MHRRIVLPGVVIALLALASSLPAQTETLRTAEQRAALLETHRGDFDYLLGDWEFTAENRVHGRFRGVWSAVRLADGQILDEYRALGDNGETYHVTTTLRNYNSAMDRWELIGANPGEGLLDLGTARRTGTEMHIEQRFGVATGSPWLWRIRYYDIRPDRFSWTADRSPDNGRSWEREYLRIEARRTGPSRALNPLTPARRP